MRHVEQAEVFVELGAKLRFGEGFKVDVHDRNLARGLPNGDSASSTALSWGAQACSVAHMAGCRDTGER